MVLFIFNVACGWRLSLCFCMGYGGSNAFIVFYINFMCPEAHDVGGIPIIMSH